MVSTTVPSSKPRVFRQARATPDEPVAGASVLLYAAGGGTATILLLLGRGVAELFTRVARAAHPARVGADPDKAAPGREASQPSAWRAWAVIHPVAFVLATLLSAWGSPAPHLAWPSVAMVVVFVLVFWTVQHLPSSALRDPLPLSRAWAAGGVILASMGLGFFLQNRYAAQTPFMGKNDLGMLLAMALPFAQMLAARGADRLLGWTAAVITGGTLFVSFSQGAWMGAAAAEGVLLAAGSPRMRRQVVVMLLVLALVGGCVAVYAWQSKAPAFGLLLSRLDLGSSSKTERIHIWTGTWQMFRDHPWVGVGMGAFSAVYPQYRIPQAREPNVWHAHNLFLHLLAETGVVGLLAFLAMVATWGIRAVRALLGQVGSRRDGVAVILAALSALFTHHLFDVPMWSLHMGVGLWILGGVLCSTAPSAPEGTAPALRGSDPA